MLASFRHCAPLNRMEWKVVLALVMSGGLAAFGQGTVFTYQGHLNEGGKAASGLYDFQFGLCDNAIGGTAIAEPVTIASVSVSNGLFTAALDFGGVFDGNPRWLDISVRTNGGGVFTSLSPRQALTPVPYAIFAGGVMASGISGAIRPNNIAKESITSTMLAPGAAAANLPSGTMVLSSESYATNLLAAGYSRAGGQLDLSWQQRAIDSPRSEHTAVWTGSRLIVWGGTLGAGSDLRSGALYDPTSNDWTSITTSNAPLPRILHTAVWTGNKMIVWGGSARGGGGTPEYWNGGGAYDPATDSWVSTTTTNAPSKRNMQTAVWTGKEMIVWGGQTYFFPTLTTFNDGGRYDPATDTWTSVTINGAPSGRYEHTALWTGSEMLVWGGSFWNGTEVAYVNEGARYSPTTDTWTAISTQGAPVPRAGHCAVWTGREMIVWGGHGTAGKRLSDGARYNPASNTWLPLPNQGAPNALSERTAVWTDKEMLVWGGDWLEPMQSGAGYDPERNSWSAMATSNGPRPRAGFTATWTGNEMLVFGGMHADEYLGDTWSYTPSRVMYLYSKP